MKKLILVLSLCFLTISCSNPIEKDEIMGTYIAYKNNFKKFRPGPEDYLITITQKDSNTYKFAYSDNWKIDDKLVINVDDAYIELDHLKLFGLERVPVIYKYKNDTINVVYRGTTMAKWIKQ